MQLRFVDKVTECADPAAVAEAAGGRCRWTGFKASVGMRAYVEEDGTDTFACPVSFAARHAGMLDTKRFAVIWAPDLQQELITDIARIRALTERAFQSLEKDLPKAQSTEVKQVRDQVERIYSGLKLRRGFVTDLQDASELPLTDLLTASSDSSRQKLLDGLRILPLGFTTAEIDSWTAPGASMEAIEVKRAYESGWFSQIPGMEPGSRTWMPLPALPRGTAEAVTTTTEKAKTLAAALDRGHDNGSSVDPLADRAEDGSD